MDLTKDYIAGLIDGEGYIGLWKAQRGYLEQRISKQENHRDSACWSLRNSTQVVPFLNDIMPHLRLKKNQAELLLEYCSLMPVYQRDKVKKTRADDIYYKLQELKHGIARRD